MFGVLRFRDPALPYLLNGPKWLTLAGLGYDVVEPFNSSHRRWFWKSKVTEFREHYYWLQTWEVMIRLNKVWLGRRNPSWVRSWKEVGQRVRVIFFGGKDCHWNRPKRGAGFSVGRCSGLKYGQREEWLSLPGNSGLSEALWGVPAFAALFPLPGLQTKAALTWSRVTFRTPGQHQGQDLDWSLTLYSIF